MRHFMKTLKNKLENGAPAFWKSSMGAASVGWSDSEGVAIMMDMPL